MSAPTAGPGPEDHRVHTGLSRRSVTALVAVVLVIAIAAAMSLIHLSYVIYKPGPAWNTLGTLGGKPLISVSGAPTYDASGALDFTTVSVYGGPGNPVNVWDLLGAKLGGTSEILPRDQVFPPGVTQKQVQTRNQAQMTNSQQEAVVVALRALGKKVPEHVIIAQVQDSSRAKGVLHEGDEILAVEGQHTSDPAAVEQVITKQKPGSTITLRLRRDGKEVTVQAPTRKVDGRTVVGVLLTSTFDFPFSVNIHAGDVGGPSAGMMFGLGVYDKLTPGSLTGGLKFAGTGTLDSAGNVGPIGGIDQKLVGARNEGARWFLAPAQNCDEVVGHIPDGLQVVKVSTFDQARHLVEQIGAGKQSSLPRCTAAGAK